MWRLLLLLLLLIRRSMEEPEHAFWTAVGEMSQFAAFVASDVFGASYRPVVVVISSVPSMILMSPVHVEFGEEVSATAVVVVPLVTSATDDTTNPVAAAIRIRVWLVLLKMMMLLVVL